CVTYPAQLPTSDVDACLVRRDTDRPNALGAGEVERIAGRQFEVGQPEADESGAAVLQRLHAAADPRRGAIVEGHRLLAAAGDGPDLLINVLLIEPEDRVGCVGSLSVPLERPFPAAAASRALHLTQIRREPGGKA